MKNVEKSAFHPGEYVGYRDGAWRIRKVSGGWRAIPSPAVRDGISFERRTLREIDDELSRVFGGGSVRHSRSNPAKRKRAAPRRKSIAGKFNSPSQLTGKPPSKRLVKRRKLTAHAPPGIFANPVRVRVGDPSIATGKPPSERLKKRRRTTDRIAPAGFYANPSGYVDHSAFRVQVKESGAWRTIAGFARIGEAKEYAKAYHAAHSSKAVRVVE